MAQKPAAAHKDRPFLLFPPSRRSGPARRMASLVAWVTVKHRRKLRVVELDIDEVRELADALEVETAPALVLLGDKVVVDKPEGRPPGPEIERFLEPHLHR